MSCFGKILHSDSQTGGTWLPGRNFTSKRRNYRQGGILGFKSNKSLIIHKEFFFQLIVFNKTILFFFKLIQNEGGIEKVLVPRGEI